MDLSSCFYHSQSTGSKYADCILFPFLFSLICFGLVRVCLFGPNTIAEPCDKEKRRVGQNGGRTVGCPWLHGPTPAPCREKVPRLSMVNTPGYVWWSPYTRPMADDHQIRDLTRAPLGGGQILPPSRILAITQELRKISPPNFQYLIGHQFDTLSKNFVKFGQKIFEKMTFQWRHVMRFWAKNGRQLYRS